MGFLCSLNYGEHGASKLFQFDEKILENHHNEDKTTIGLQSLPEVSAGRVKGKKKVRQGPMGSVTPFPRPIFYKNMLQGLPTEVKKVYKEGTREMKHIMENDLLMLLGQLRDSQGQ